MLFRDADKLKEYAQITGTIHFDGLKASLRMVELKYIIPIIGKDLYQALDEALTDATVQDPLDEVFVNLLHQCRMAIGPLFCYFHADKADVQFSDAGMQRAESSTNKNAYQEQRQKFKEANLSEGEEALELLLQFLEENKEDYTEWTDSENFKKYRSLFIKSGSAFNELFPSQTPHRNYWLLRATMYDVEENNIRAFLGSTLYEDLKEEDAKLDPEFSDEQAALLHRLKKAIANLTVCLAVPFINVRLGSNGLTVPAVTTFSQNDADNTRNGIDHQMIDTFIKACNNAANTWLLNAKDYLTNHKTDFPDWIGFATPATECPPSINDGFTAVWGM